MHAELHVHVHICTVTRLAYSILLISYKDKFYCCRQHCLIHMQRQADSFISLYIRCASVKATSWGLSSYPSIPITVLNIINFFGLKDGWVARSSPCSCAAHGFIQTHVWLFSSSSEIKNLVHYIPHSRTLEKNSVQK